MAVRSRANRSESDREESYFVSMTDIMIGLLFIFLILLTYFAFQIQEDAVPRVEYEEMKAQRDAMKAQRDALLHEIEGLKIKIVSLEKERDGLLIIVVGLESRIGALKGEGVDDIIKRIDLAARQYPYQHGYKAYPGPNSNTFTAWVARHVPELRLDLPPTAIGKDFLGDRLVSEVPSGTGYQFNIKGLFGVLAAVEEGLEVNLAGLTFGVDPLNLASKMPGIGRVGLIRQVAQSEEVRGR